MRFKFSLFCNTSSPAPGLGTATSEPKVPADTPVPGAPHPTLGSPMRAAPVWGHPARPVHPPAAIVSIKSRGSNGPSTQ